MEASLALKQRLGKWTAVGIVIPWFKKIVTETREAFSNLDFQPRIASLDDIILPTELSLL